MVRPKTALGTFGRVTVVPQIQDGSGRWITAQAGVRPSRWRARAKHRDPDGVLRDVERFAPTKAKAEYNLRQGLTARTAPGRGDVLRVGMTVADAGEVWLSQVRRPDSNLAERSRQQYADAFKRYVAHSTIKGLTLQEVNRVPVLEQWLQGVADKHGSGAAKTARSVVSGVLSLAVRYRVLDYNAMREVRPAKASAVKTTARDTTRALTREQRQHLLSVADADEAAVAYDIADLLAWLAGTGVRMGEALGQAWKDVDLEAGTVLVRGTKTAASTRTLHLPEWLLQRLRQRADSRGTEGLVFSSPRTVDRHKPRDRRNADRIVRCVLDTAGFPWATGHTFRRTVATMLDEAGQPIVLAANQLGHKDPSMTARVYLGRKGSTAAAARHL